MIEGLSHPKLFDRRTKSAIIVKDNELVRSYLPILLSSTVHEFLAEPSYGSKLKSLIYEPINDVALIDSVKNSIIDAIAAYAPSIVVEWDDIDISTNDNEGTIFVLISYRWSNLSEKYTFDFTISQ